VFDKSGNLYGTTLSGGTSDHPRAGSTLFKPSPGADGWTETVLANFNAPGGARPDSVPSFDSFGNLYGSLGVGGPRSDGAVFQWNHSNGEVREISFSGSDSLFPAGGVLVDALHRGFFGVTTYGGNSGIANTAGVLYQISPSGKKTTLYKFCSQPNCTDGAEPMGNLVEDPEGNLYGTAAAQGGAYGFGVVFEITP
jgi:uncharacterized repeat protein (TIGR03803 family)